MDPIDLLSQLQKLSLQAFRAGSLRQLNFLMLNETAKLVHYSRACLFDSNRKLLGVSGQSSTSASAESVVEWNEKAQKQQNPREIHQFTHRGQNILWLPLHAHDALSRVLWLERQEEWTEDEITLLTYLADSYGAALERYSSKLADLQKMFKGALTATLIGLALGSLFVVRLPLRIVAPCEIVAQEPIVITAPLDGIIEEVLVVPGQQVMAGDKLVDYDKQAPLQQLESTRKQVEIARSELNRAMTLAFSDQDPLSQVATLRLQLQKEEIALELAEYQASKLEIVAPSNGVVTIDQPEEWKGKPVRVGERILSVADPKRTKVKVWVGEQDNVGFNVEEPIKVFLNVRPELSLAAKVSYVANHVAMSDRGVASYIVDAEWDEEVDEARLGLRGTAVLYGENVSLFYWLFRRPWISLRHWVGI